MQRPVGLYTIPRLDFEQVRSEKSLFIRHNRKSLPRLSRKMEASKNGNKEITLKKTVILPRRKYSRIVSCDAPNFYDQYLRYDQRYTYNIIGKYRAEYINTECIYMCN